MSRMIFVGVGPGDPELMTIKAVSAIESADLIALPDSEVGDGAAERIVARWIAGKDVLRLPMPMAGEQRNWQEAHQQAAEKLIAQLELGKTVVYPVLGDPSLYATSGYLLKLIAPRHACEVIPGVPALCAMAARLQIPLAEGREPLTVLPGYNPEFPIPPGNVVIMKAGRQLSALQSELISACRPAWMVQNLGMPKERVSPISKIDPEAKQSYFTTVLIKDS